MTDGDVASVTINTDDRRIEPPDGLSCSTSSSRAGWCEVPDDLDALRAGWRKTSSNLFRSLKKADKSGLEFREAESPGTCGAFIACTCAP